MKTTSFTRCAGNLNLVRAGLMALAIAAGGQAAAASSTAKDQGTGAMPKADRSFLTKAAQGGVAEVELGKLAQDKAQNPQVKEFAARMVKDHGEANEKLKKIASSKGVDLPSDASKSARSEMDKLAQKSGGDFDREYMKHMVSDHKKDVSEFEKQAKSGKDAELKAFADQTLPTLREHLKMAQSAEAAVKSKRGAGSPTARNDTGSTR